MSTRRKADACIVSLLLLAILSGCRTGPVHSDAPAPVNVVASQNVPAPVARIEARTSRPGFWSRHPVLKYGMIAVGVATVVYLLRRAAGGSDSAHRSGNGCYLRKREVGVIIPIEHHCQSDQNNTDWLRCCP
jgi:hypothetical protein